MKTLPDGCVQTCITSPPYYGLRSYDGGSDEIGCENSPDAFVAKMVEVFREVRRILRDDGTVWLNIGDSYATTSGGMQQRLKMGANTPNYGGIKYPSDLAGVSQSGKVGARQNGLKHKDLIGIPWRVAMALQADGWYLRQDIIWYKPNPLPESVTDRCSKAHEYIFLLSKEPDYYFDHDIIREDAVTPIKPKTAKRKNPGLRMGIDRNNFRDWKEDGKRNKRSVWIVNTRPFKGAHRATYPKDLILPCVLAGCPKGGTVFDPFTGSGTTAIVALENGRNFIGTELNPDYMKIAEDRIREEIPDTLQDLLESNDTNP